MNVITVQHNVAWGERKANFDTIRRLLTAGETAAGSLIVLPEMFSTGYNMEVDAVAESSRSGTEEFLSTLAWEYQSHIVGGLVTRDPSSGKGRNELAVFNPAGRPLALYQKNHTFSYAGESDHYLPGDGLALFDWNGFKVCPLICYDLRFPELFRTAVRAGTTLFTVSANWPASRIGHWNTLLAARAIENLSYVVGVNRVGSDPHHEYSGSSRIIDPQGKILAEADHSETVLSAPADLEGLRAWREEFPALRDMKA